MKLRFVSLAMALLLGACATASPKDVLKSDFKGLRASHECIQWQRASHCYYYTAPRSQARALVLMLDPPYGGLSGLFNREDRYEFARKAVVKGVAVAYPEGYNGDWEARPVAVRAKDESARRRDYAAFVNRVIQKLRANAGVSPQHVTVVLNGQAWTGKGASNWYAGRGGKKVANGQAILDIIPKASFVARPVTAPDNEADDVLPDGAPDGDRPINTLDE